MNPSKVWYVTGASQGFGLSLVKKLLAAGYRVAATSRKLESLTQAVGAVDAAHFLPMAVDLGDSDAIRLSVQRTQAHFGAIDVLVNNAGYGMAGTLEETAEPDRKSVV